MTTLEQRLEHAATLRRSGHNCAQCVMLAFSDIISDRMPEDAAEAFSIALGGGVGGTGHFVGGRCVSHDAYGGGHGADGSAYMAGAAHTTA